MTAIEMIQSERQRQVSKGYDAAHTSGTALDNLAKAGALIVAEMERVMRAERTEVGSVHPSSLTDVLAVAEDDRLAMQKTARLLRAALVKVVGSDDPDELAGMHKLLSEAKKAGADVDASSLEAISVLLLVRGV